MSLHEVQIALEAESVSLGIERYNAALESQGQAQMPPGMKLIRDTVIPLAEAIEAFTTEATSGRAGRDVSRAKFLLQFDPKTVAYITAKVCINSLSQDLKLQAVAFNVAGLLEDTINFDLIKKEEPKVYSRLLNKIKKSSANGSYRHIIMRNTQNKAQIASIKWGRNDKMNLGLHLIRMMEQTTGYIKIEPLVVGAKDTPLILTTPPDIQEWLEKSHSNCELLNPLSLPMVVPPRPWNAPYNGGYLTKPLSYALIKTQNRNLLEEYKSIDMPKIYRAVNALQNTAWRINKTVLKVMAEIWDGGSSLGGLPMRDDELPPAKNYSDPEENPEAHRAWRVEAAKVHERNMKLRHARRIMAHKIRLADKFQEFEAIYFPHVLDWRGRIYPVAVHLNPQADDAGKALLTFSEGKPLGVNGAYWLAVHGANCAGVDKVSFEERVQWVQDHEQEILDSAFDPLDGKRFWAEQDSPFQFLAFCFEWAGYTVQGQDYVSHLSVSWDGSCNGLQNYSAMLRDEIGGKATNLIPSDTPSDIYSEVAKEAQAIVAEDAKRPMPVVKPRAPGSKKTEAEELRDKIVAAQNWNGKIARGIAKRPTMTLPYGAGRYGFSDQIQAELVKLSHGKAEPYIQGEDFQNAVYLAEVMEDAIGNVVVKAKQAMDWLKEVAKIAAKDGLPIHWDTPSGFLVVQDYRKYDGVRLDSTIAGVRTQLTLRVESDAIDTRKQAQGIAPNFVHSMDASHLVLTVNKCLDVGITSLAMIHDSYGTHAADADTLSEQLREAFIEQYSGDVLGVFIENLRQQLPEELMKQLPERPTPGKLELAGVRDSRYFFA
jgi:DNA-directed RNA polymerase